MTTVQRLNELNKKELSLYRRLDKKDKDNKAKRKSKMERSGKKTSWKMDEAFASAASTSYCDCQSLIAPLPRALVALWFTRPSPGRPFPIYLKYTVDTYITFPCARHDNLCEKCGTRVSSPQLRRK